MQKRVFVASTGRDLMECREAVIEALRGLDGYEPVSMDRFSARPDKAVDYCRERVSQCDLFIGIIGHLYGSRPQGMQESFTQLEYREAKNQNLPRLMFVAAPEFRLPANLMSDFAKYKDLQDDFRQEVNQEGIRKSFTSANDLVIKVIQALHNWHQKSLTDRAEERTTALASMTPLYLLQGNDLRQAFKVITEKIARTLSIERVSIWRYTLDNTAIACQDLYVLSERRHELCNNLETRPYPRYFSALKTEKILDADDARTDPRTCEFLNDYLIPNDIYSMMDVRILLSSYNVAGVVCHEQTGQKHKWTSDEKTFAIAAANLVSFAIEAFEQRDLKEKSQQMEQELLELKRLSAGEGTPLNHSGSVSLS